MTPFNIMGADHYCRSFQTNTGDSEKSPEDFLRTKRISGNRLINEGTSLFSEYRDCALRDAERSLFLSASHYRRCLDMMIPSSSSWAQVTLYYGAWYAARAILGMFGCSIFNKLIVQVDASAPNAQSLQVQRIGSGQGQYLTAQTGSHRRFWEIFYKVGTRLYQFVDPSFAASLTPISNSETWLIEQRNSVNYDSLESVQIANAFSQSFSVINFPGSLTGALSTQYAVTEGLLAVGCSFAKQFGLKTDALQALDSSSTFQQKVKNLIYGPVTPNLVGQTLHRQIF